MHCSGWQIVDYHQTPRPGGDFGQASLHPAVGLVPVVRDTVESPTQPNPPRRSPLYFAGPEGVLLELTTGDPTGPQAWIDPEICRDQRHQHRRTRGVQEPRAIHPAGRPRSRPGLRPCQTHIAIAPEAYQQILAMPDEVVWQMASQPEPPVPQRVERRSP